jgi:RluA family pseudouridine synthase
MDDRDIEVRGEKKKRKPIRFQDTILFEDDRVVVTNKPVGIASMPERDLSEPSFFNLARAYDSTLKICHRLDKNTSGILLFAKGADMYREISILFEHREVVKYYIALVHGVHQFNELVIDLPLGDNGRGKAKVNQSSGKESITVFDTAEIIGDFTLVDCHPLTGRLHQIRIHLSAAGAPIIGDVDYGGKDVFLSEIKPGYKYNRKEKEPPINEGFLLHSRGTSLVLPGDEEATNFVAPVNEKFETALKILRKYAK